MSIFNPTVNPWQQPFTGNGGSMQQQFQQFNPYNQIGPILNDYLQHGGRNWFGPPQNPGFYPPVFQGFYGSGLPPVFTGGAPTGPVGGLDGYGAGFVGPVGGVYGTIVGYNNGLGNGGPLGGAYEVLQATQGWGAGGFAGTGWFPGAPFDGFGYWNPAWSRQR